MINLLLSKLPHLSREEIEKMLAPVLSDVRKSRFYQEVSNEGKLEGIQERNREIAKALMRERMSLKRISKVTGLSEAELRALKKASAVRKS